MATGVPPKNGNKTKRIPFSLTYDGKEDITTVLAHSAASFIESAKINGTSDNQFFFGDNLDSLAYLLKNGFAGKIQLVYIDPPYSTASIFLNREQKHAYSDSLCGAEYVEFLRRRLIFLYELLADDGSIYLHLDGNMAFPIKLILDEVFGCDKCRAFITRKKCSTKNYTKNTYGNISDYIMFYSKTSKFIWNRPYTEWNDEKLIEQYPCVDEKTGRRYKKVPIHAPGERNGETGKKWRGIMPPPGKHWQYIPQKLDEMNSAGEIYWSPTGNPRRMIFCDPSKGIPIQDIWLDYRDSINQSHQTTGYPTEKNYEMLKMIVRTSSNAGGLVLDCFAGSGTTLQAAFELGRTWIGADNSPESLKAILKRFTVGLEKYGDYVNGSQFTQSYFNLHDNCPFTIFTSVNDNAIVQNILQTKTLKLLQETDFDCNA